jgi:hypothetical protein
MSGESERVRERPVRVSRIRAPPSVRVEEESGSHSSTRRLVKMAMLGAAAALWNRIFEARKVSLRWMIVTCRQGRCELEHSVSDL